MGLPWAIRALLDGYYWWVRFRQRWTPPPAPDPAPPLPPQIPTEGGGWVVCIPHIGMDLGPAEHPRHTPRPSPHEMPEHPTIQ